MSESESEDEYSSPKTYWGEIPPDPDEMFAELPDVSEDIKKAMQQNCLDEFPDDENAMQIKDLVLPPMDPLMIYAIQLHKWMVNMTETIRMTELTIESNLIPPADVKSPIPPMPDVQIKHRLNNLNFMPTKSTRESKKDEIQIPELSEPIVKKILTQCAATMIAHIGYEESSQIVLDILVDILEQFLIKVCERVVTALNEEENLNTGGFPNVIERVLVEMGMGGAKGLYEYYQCRVLKYINVLQMRCKELEDHYSELLKPKTESSAADIGKMIKVEIKEGAKGDVFEIGYQLLDSLEADTKVEGLSDTGDGF